MTNEIEKIEKLIYTARAHTTGGREGGTSRTDDGRLEVNFSSPGHGTGTNPEQLFAAGWSACFLSPMKLIARKERIPLPDNVSIDAEVDLGQTNVCERGWNVSLTVEARLFSTGCSRGSTAHRPIAFRRAIGSE